MGWHSDKPCRIYAMKMGLLHLCDANPFLCQENHKLVVMISTLFKSNCFDDSSVCISWG